jgi:SAM-dependent methyltransferase
VHRDSVVDEFTRQSRSFNASPAMTSAATLQSLVDLMPLAPDQRWLEVACGPGLIARAIAPRVRSVHGVDLTAAMVELARAEAARVGAANARFSLGDATRLDLPDASYDGAVTRFSLHHIPLPGRCLVEMARVVRPGGLVVLADGVASEDGAATAWHQEIERLRDPSHWAHLTVARVRSLARAAGLDPVEERIVPLALDSVEWLERGSGAAANRELIAAALAERPEQSDCFRLAGGVLTTSYYQSIWRRAPAA